MTNLPSGRGLKIRQDLRAILVDGLVMAVGIAVGAPAILILATLFTGGL